MEMKKVIKPVLFFLLLLSPLLSQEKIRKSAVAGSWYPGDPAALRLEVKKYLDESRSFSINGEIYGIVSPHAGYYYSGKAAAAVYKQIEGKIYDVIIIIAPSHQEAFRGSSVYPGDAYETPFGKVFINKDIARKIVQGGKTVNFSDKGHLLRGIPREHSLEIQLPFLQVVLPEFKIVPVIMGEQNYHNCKDLGEAIAEAVRGKKALIVASSDLSHFHEYKEAVEMDKNVLDAFENFDYVNLIRNFETRQWEACGGGPIVAMMIASDKLGAKKSQLLTYYNSGDISGADRNSVVGYAGGVIYKNE